MVDLYMRGESFEYMQTATSTRASRLGRCNSTIRKEHATLGVTAGATKLARNRPAQQKLVASQCRKSYAIILLEASTIDVIDYQDRIGGLDEAVTVLSEFVNRVDPENRLATVLTELARVSDQQALN